MAFGRSKFSLCVAAATLLVLSLASMPQALAQDPTSPPPNILPPPPPPIPPPRIEVPRIPKMDEIPTSPRAALPRQKSFDRRVQECIAEGAAAGLNPNERAAYSRACVNSR
jgi:hypothetical protein